MNERAFVEDIKRSLGRADKVLPDTHEGAQGKLCTFPPLTSIPPPWPLYCPRRIVASLKSIRNPKFTVQYEIMDSESIFALKQKLVNDPKGFFVGSSVGIESLRLLVRAHAVSDTRQLCELDSTDFTVMVLNHPLQTDKTISLTSNLLDVEAESGAVKDFSAPSEQLDADDVPSDHREKPQFISEQFWSEIKSVIESHNLDAATLLDRFRQSVDNLDLA